MSSGSIQDEFDLLKKEGNENFKLRRYDAAIQNYSNAISLKPDEPTIYSNRAQCYLNLRRFFDALSDSDRAIELDVDSAKSHYRRAVALKGLSRYEEALISFRKVLQLDPSFTLIMKDMKHIEDLLSNDTRVDLKPCDKPMTLRSKKEVKTFELNNHYVGTKHY